ncbi:MAG: AsnC family transcriptional regulator [Actinobacteria bacterium]|jgi:predicted transcriptional regulator|nr:AsnC family transcriptional regulator [Actinomycetota bacterium]MCL6105382.1 AsnC family transcriptional regulator [Actinomycetota bacterium]
MSEQSWTFLTNHGHVLVCIATDRGIRGRDIAIRVGITERAAQSIIADLVKAGYVRKKRVGRRNHYEVITDKPFRHPVEQPHNIGELVELLTDIPGFTPVPTAAKSRGTDPKTNLPKSV